MREYLEKINSSSHHLMDLINGVLEMSRIENGRIELNEKFYDIRMLFDHVESMMNGQAEEKGLSLKVELKNLRHPVICCDRVRVNQILINLISNAIKFTPEGGEIIVTAEETEDIDELHANYELRVKDNGIGMDEEFAKHVFEPLLKGEHSDVIDRSMILREGVLTQKFDYLTAFAKGK